jgi:DNA repair protein RadC
MKLKDWNMEDRPREKLLHRGAAALENAELLAILIGSGVPGTNVVSMAQELLSSAGGRLTELFGQTTRDLMGHKGIGPARAVAIAAALELGRRYLAEASAEKRVITGPEDVFRRMLPLMKGLDHEECWALYLDRVNHVTGQERLTSGTVDGTFIDTKRVIRNVLDRQAKAVILVHNHPSGSPLPGEADIRATRQLQLALRTFDARLYDHVIVADGSYYSFQEEGVGKSE